MNTEYQVKLINKLFDNNEIDDNIKSCDCGKCYINYKNAIITFGSGCTILSIAIDNVSIEFDNNGNILTYNYDDKSKTRIDKNDILIDKELLRLNTSYGIPVIKYNEILNNPIKTNVNTFIEYYNKFKNYKKHKNIINLSNDIKLNIIDAIINPNTEIMHNTTIKYTNNNIIESITTLLPELRKKKITYFDNGNIKKIETLTMFHGDILTYEEFNINGISFGNFNYVDGKQIGWQLHQYDDPNMPYKRYLVYKYNNIEILNNLSFINDLLLLNDERLKILSDPNLVLPNANHNDHPEHKEIYEKHKYSGYINFLKEL
jgi:hypothetical protein